MRACVWSCRCGGFVGFRVGYAATGTHHFTVHLDGNGASNDDTAEHGSC